MKFFLLSILFCSIAVSQVKFGTVPLKIDSVASRQQGLTIYKDSAGTQYTIIKIEQDGTFKAANGARLARITDKELTPNQLGYIYLESEALAIELIASKQAATARKEIK